MIDVGQSLPGLGIGVTAAVLYALAAQMAFRSRRAARYLGVFSLGFLVGVPFAMGFVAVIVATAWQRLPPVVLLALPWLACLVAIGLTLALHWEAAIAAVMALPLCLV